MFGFFAYKSHFFISHKRAENIWRSGQGNVNTKTQKQSRFMIKRVGRRKIDKCDFQAVSQERIRATSLLVLSGGSPSTYKVLEASGGRGFVSCPVLVPSRPPMPTFRPFGAKSGPPSPWRPSTAGSAIERPGIPPPDTLPNPTPRSVLASPEVREESCFKAIMTNF